MFLVSKDSKCLHDKENITLILDISKMIMSVSKISAYFSDDIFIEGNDKDREYIVKIKDEKTYYIAKLTSLLEVFRQTEKKNLGSKDILLIDCQLFESTLQYIVKLMSDNQLMILNSAPIKDNALSEKGYVSGNRLLCEDAVRSGKKIDINAGLLLHILCDSPFSLGNEWQVFSLYNFLLALQFKREDKKQEIYKERNIPEVGRKKKWFEKAGVFYWKRKKIRVYSEAFRILLKAAVLELYKDNVRLLYQIEDWGREDEQMDELIRLLGNLSVPQEMFIETVKEVFTEGWRI